MHRVIPKPRTATHPSNESNYVVPIGPLNHTRLVLPLINSGIFPTTPLPSSSPSDHPRERPRSSPTSSTALAGLAISLHINGRVDIKPGDRRAGRVPAHRRHVP